MTANPAEKTLPQVLALQAGRLGSATAIREKALGIWQHYSWADYFRYVRHTAGGLMLLGLKRGEHVGLILNNHPEWLFSELGAQSLGAVNCPWFGQ